MGTRHTEYYRDYAITLAYAGDEEEAQKVLQEAIDYGLTEDSVYYAKGEIEMLSADRMRRFRNLKSVSVSQMIWK